MYISSEDKIAFLIDMDTRYHNGESDLISDLEYDQLKAEARKEFPNDPYFETVGAAPSKDKVDLPYTLGSQEKRKFDGSLNEWLTENGIATIAAGDKLDGCSFSVEYDGGHPVFATTRGDGYQGQDITEKAKVFCPKSQHKGNFHLRGEVLALTSTARGLGYKKSRTFVAGVLNSDGMKHVEHLYVVFYLVLDFDYDSYNKHIEAIESFGLPAVNYETFDVVFLMNRNMNMEEILADHYKNRKDESQWDIDGLVIVDNENPNHTDDYYPSNSCAFKVNEDAIETKVISVEWEVKRSGKIQPVVHIEPIEISGSTVTKATGFNYGFIRDNKIGPGAIVGVVLSGEIIPYIETIVLESIFDSTPIVCPSCDGRLTLSSTLVDKFCFNDDCEGKELYWIENFLLSNGVEEMSVSTLKKLEFGGIFNLLVLDEFDISVQEGFGSSRASTIVKQIKKIYNTTPANLLRSFGITGCGNTMSAEIVHHFDGNFESIFGATKEEFMSIEGIGHKMAERLIDELPDHRNLYDFLSERGLTFAEKEGDSLKGKKITLTGKSEIKRNELKKAIEAQGGMVKGISKGVDFLFTNSPESTTTKMKKAKEHGITIMPYEELYKILDIEVGL